MKLTDAEISEPDVTLNWNSDAEVSRELYERLNLYGIRENLACTKFSVTIPGYVWRAIQKEMMRLHAPSDPLQLPPK